MYHEEALLTMQQVSVIRRDGTELGPIDWQIPSGKRIHLDCADDEACELVLGLLTGRVHPVRGHVTEFRTVVVQSEAKLRQTAHGGGTIDEFLHAPDTPERVWLEQRRRTVRMLVDALGLSPHQLRRPLKLCGEAVTERYVALRFILSRADLLLGDALFRSPDPYIRRALRMRWPDFTATVVAVNPSGELPGPVQQHARLERDGRFTVTPTAPPDDPG